LFTLQGTAIGFWSLQAEVPAAGNDSVGCIQLLRAHPRLKVPTGDYDIILRAGEVRDELRAVFGTALHEIVASIRSPEHSAHGILVA